MEQSRRVRAARGSVNQSLDEFAAAIGVGRGTLVRIEAGTRTAKPHELAAMADVSGLPLAFFTVADLHDALGEAPPEEDRLTRLEAKYDELASRYDSYLDIMREEVVRAATAAVDATLQAKTATAPDTDATDHPPERTAEDPQ